MSLLREAQLRGLIDCRTARLLDRDWWLGVGWALAWLEGQLFTEVAELKYQLHVALLDYDLEKKTFDHHWDQAQLLQALIHGHKLPWLKSGAKVDQAAVASMAQTWKAIFGDPADPTVAARIQETAAALTRRATGARKNGDDQHR